MKAKPTAHDPWEARFETELKDDACAERIFAQLLKRGILRRSLILLLEAVTDPDIDWKLQRFIEPGRIPKKGAKSLPIFFPSKQSARHLSKQLRNASEEIRRFWLRTYFGAFPYSRTALATAKILDEQAQALDEVPWKEINKRIGFKGYWRQVPLVWLCLELHVPADFAYVDLSQLLAVALRAHCRNDDDPRFSPDALRKQYDRFYKRQGALDPGLELLSSSLAHILPSE